MWSKSLNLVLVLFPCLLFSQSDVSKAVHDLIEDEEYEEAIKQADSLLNLSQFYEDYYYLYSKKGDAYYYLADIKNSLKNYLLASEEPQIKLLENRKVLQETFSNIGFCYSDLGIHDKALQYYKASFDLAVELNDSSEVAVGYYNMSNAHLKQGSLEEGMNLLELAYAIDKQRRDTAAIGFDLNTLGYAALEMNNPDEAIQYFKESILLLAKSSGNYNSLGTRYNNLSKAFLRKSEWDSALFYNKKSIEIHEQFNDEINLANRWINRAMILNQMDFPEQALEWSLKASDRVAQLKKSDLILMANTAAVESYEKQGRKQAAIKLTETNIKLAEEIRSIKHLHIAQKKYAQLLNKVGRSGEAYDALRTAGILSDSIKTIEAQRAASELAVKYEVDKIASENEILQLESDVAIAKLAQEQNTTFWLTVLVIIVLVTGSLITYSLISKSRIKEQLMQSEISELRLQIKQLIDFKPEESHISIDQLNKALKEPLSDREFEVLQMAMTDKNNSEIADKIYISTNTVKYHLKNVYQKLGVSNRKEALKFAFQATSS
ncbi:tetratricopeptide repeat protein [Ekhidna sp.]|uniref:tetratricopeptide repeat protein n=1 Tax=Ekhidna sp. TaxID=2608089 RepID=UPI003B5B6D71